MTNVRSILTVVLALLHSVVVHAGDPKESTLPPFSEVKHTVETVFTAQKGRRPGDLISQSEVEQAIAEVAKLGWEIHDKSEVLGLVLPDQHILVTTFRTPAGKKFMQQISGRELMYDRLDRISEVSGGSRLIRDVVKLPDGERYAKPKSGGGVPDLLDLLPKNASGQTRRIPDYHKPTGRIYTVSALLERLAESYKTASEAMPANAK